MSTIVQVDTLTSGLPLVLLVCGMRNANVVTMYS